MKLSKDRILTTHVGSLPRSEKVFKLVFAKEAGGNLDKQEYEDVIADAVQTVVNKQQKAGIDVVSDGEQSKISYATYIKDRLNGFEGPTHPERTSTEDNYPRRTRKCLTTRRRNTVAAVSPRSNAQAPHGTPTCLCPLPRSGT